jgi:hypothetical protein
VIEDVARSLAAAIPDCTAEDIADILWLATTLPPAPDSAPAVPDSETAPAPEPVSDTPVPPPMETEQPQADEPEAMLAQGAGPVSGGQVVSATAVGLRAPAATNRALSPAPRSARGRYRRHRGSHRRCATSYRCDETRARARV